MEESLKKQLKRHAARNGRSMKAEVREILRNAVAETSAPIKQLGSRIAERFSEVGLRDDLPKLHGQVTRAADFKQ